MELKELSLEMKSQVDWIIYFKGYLLGSWMTLKQQLMPVTQPYDWSGVWMAGQLT
jgi:hypothetical protein